MTVFGRNYNKWKYRIPREFCIFNFRGEITKNDNKDDI